MLDADEFHRRDIALVFETEIHDLTNPLHQRIHTLRLGMAAGNGGDGCHVVAVLVSLDNNCEFAGGFHMGILARI